MTWHSKKQQVIAHSSAEVEFQALAHGICKDMQLKCLLIDLRCEPEGPKEVLCDNRLAISIAKKLFHHDRTKYVEMD